MEISCAWREAGLTRKGSIRGPGFPVWCSGLKLEVCGVDVTELRLLELLQGTAPFHLPATRSSGKSFPRGQVWRARALFNLSQSRTRALGVFRPPPYLTLQAVKGH
jgi:hypothetical protein